MAGPELSATPRAPAAEQSFALRSLFSLAMLALLCLLCAPYFASPVARDAPEVRGGAIDLTRMDMAARPVAIEGNWLLQWRAGPDGAPEAAAPFPVRVPGVWAGQTRPDGSALPGQGLATYRLTIGGLPPGDYRLHVPTIFGASRVLIDGKVKSTRGTVGLTPDATRYFWRSQDIAFEAQGGNILLEIEVATFLHRRNGLEAAPVIGAAETMQAWSALHWAQEMLFQVSLMLLGVFSLTVFLFRRSDHVSLFVAISCFGFMPSTMLLGYDNLWLILFPNMSLRTMLAIVDLAGTISVLSVLAYEHTLFPAESPRKVAIGLGVLVCGLLAMQAFNYSFSTILTTSRMNVYGFFVQLLVFPYILFVLIRAALHRRVGAVPFLIGMGIFFATVVMMSIVAYGVLPGDRVTGIDYTAFGVLIMLYSHLVVLAERWSQTIIASEAMTDELRQLLEVNSSITSEVELGTLLKRIVEVTSRILHAERSTLFLHDAGRGDLWSLVAEGVETKEIRIAADQGLAGAAFSSGQTVAVADAYQDSRFNPAIDAQTGFTTKSVLAMPIVARDGRKLGVMQALNRNGRGGFSQADIARMNAFAAQAAISIDNATLFSEVVAARNYNESILGSMSSGVITIDAGGRIGKLNEAAQRIFRVDEAEIAGVDARALLARRNGWLNEEIDAVRADGKARSRLDTDLIANDGSPVSANVAIVPLTGDGAAIGILVIVEDISEGKRLEGTMRRFMPQEVVKEVLGRGEDLLFGSAIPASVLFADIRSFTTMAEALSPRETVDMLNEIFSEMFEAVAETDGMIDKYMGDAVMAVYGAPLPTGDDAVNAVSGAIAMMRAIAALNQTRAARGQKPLRLGAGIASGEVVAGTIGSPKRMDYTVIGDTVNLAARLQDATKAYGVDAIVCDGTAAKVAGRHLLRDLDTIRVRGRSRPTRIFEIVAAGKTSAALAEAYAKGRAASDVHDWPAALAAFEEATSIAPEDRASALMRDRALGALSSPPPVDWDGVW